MSMWSIKNLSLITTALPPAGFIKGQVGPGLLIVSLALLTAIFGLEDEGRLFSVGPSKMENSIVSKNFTHGRYFTFL